METWSERRCPECGLRVMTDQPIVGGPCPGCGSELGPTEEMSSAAGMANFASLLLRPGKDSPEMYLALGDLVASLEHEWHRGALPSLVPCEEGWDLYRGDQFLGKVVGTDRDGGGWVCLAAGIAPAGYDPKPQATPMAAVVRLLDALPREGEEAPAAGWTGT